MALPRIRWALILCLVLNAASLHGQSTEEGDTVPAGPVYKTQLLPLGGVRNGAPLGRSLYGGVMLGRENPVGASGPSLIGEIGQDAMRFSLGMSSIGMGTARAQLSYIRTWDRHGDVHADQSYLGPEIG